MPENEKNDDGGGPWTLVQPRRSRSLDNLKQIKVQKDLFLYTKLSKEQEAAVRAAENQLTATQLEQIRKRDMIVQQQQPKSPGTGTLSYVAKGKFTDHNEEISDDELNTEKQKAALNKWNVIRNEQSKSGESQIEHTSDQESHRGRKKINGSKRARERKAKKARFDAQSSDETSSSEEQTSSKLEKSKSSKEKLDETSKPMSTRYAKKLKDMVKGRTPTPSHSGNQFSIQPVDQLPPNSLLAKVRIKF
ncbi:hypothetical protein F5879DRAFT_976252 [Lentinula edodes]|nr:hypothetical protein F5879DRAFT_976252 [Lentinula edodes]